MSSPSSSPSSSSSSSSQSSSSTSLNLSSLLPLNWETKVHQWLEEDTPSFDYGGFVVGDKPEVAELLLKAEGVLAGVPFVNKIFSLLDCKVEWKYEEGSYLSPGDSGRLVVATVHGTVNRLLQGERVALNLIARASGIATRSRKLADLAKEKGYNGIIAGTRKTTPGFRLVEKYALLVGGVDTHRMDLSSMIMLKDNHVWSTGSITNAVKKAKQVGGFSMKVEVECRSLEEAREAANAGADVIMLDNFSTDALKQAAETLKNEYKSTGKNFLIEASGGITAETISDYFSPFVDVLSLGSLTQGVPHIDFSLKIKKRSS